MDDETRKLIQEQYAKLPKQLQEAIQSSHVNELITAIATANKLHIDQIGEFENEVMMLMMGFTDPIEFVGEIQKTLSLSAEAALKIATDTNEQILLPIREKMENATADAVSTAHPATNAPIVNTPPTEGKSVVMPSATKVPAPAAAVPTVTSATSIAVPTPMPVQPVTPPVTAPAAAPIMSATPAVPEIIKPAGLPMMPHVDAMLSAPTVSIAPKPAMQTVPTVAPATPAVPPAEVAKTEPPKPGPIYKTDPYHEPID